MAKIPKVRREAHRICNLVPSHSPEKDWRFKHAIEANAVSAPPAALPASVDLRAAWWNVGDQESTGSCVGWGSTDGVARYHFVKAGRLQKCKAVSALYLDGIEGNRHLDHPSGNFHR